MKVKELNRIKIYLKPEDKKRIAKKNKVKANYVRAILRGERFKEKILEDLIDRALQIKAAQEAKLQKRSQKISQL